ncbi:hypothetical protein CRUP_010713 [Coryphaenoides rupestris]|nr:hypothetical protein CRUP_010713 [Coryphaenoides rupestris]
MDSDFIVLVYLKGPPTSLGCLLVSSWLLLLLLLLESFCTGGGRAMWCCWGRVIPSSRAA